MKIKFTLLFFLCIGSFQLSGQTYLMDGSDTLVTTCSGFFVDSGGGSASYGPNENHTLTICPDGSTGTHIQLNFSGTEIEASDLMDFYDGTDTNAPLLASVGEFGGNPFIIQATAPNTSGCITIVFTSDSAGEGQGWSAIIECIPACQLIQAQLVNSNPDVMPLDTGYIDICPGDLVSFSGAGSYPQNGELYEHSDLNSSFEWDFGDGSKGLGPNVTHVFDEPGGYIVQLTITDTLGCTNSNFINQRVRVATRPSFDIVEADPVCVGDTVELRANVTQDDSLANLQVFPPPEGSFQAGAIRSDSLALPDGTGSAYMTSLNFTNFSPGQLLTSIDDLESICVVMEHSYLRDLEISLSCPDGTSITLHNFAGQTGGEVFLGEPFEADEGLPEPIPGVGYEYCWTPDATNGTWLQYANNNFPNTLPPGDYNAFDALDNFVGCPLNGEWTISVEDLWGVDNGFIFSWSINFNPGIYPSLETYQNIITDYTWSTAPTQIFVSQDSMSAAPPNAGIGAYEFTITDDFGCVWDTLVSVDILPATHPDCYDCQQNIAPFPDTVACAGEPLEMDVEFNPPSPPVTFEAALDYLFGNGNHPPGDPFSPAIEVNSIYPDVITDPVQDIVSICIDLETNFLGDIDVILLTPNGDQLELTTGNGGTSDFYTQTCFTPTAITPITAGASPYTGNFQPEGDWSVLTGNPVNGDWTLLVSDDSGPNSLGTFYSWSITFNTESFVNYTWSPNNGSLSCINCPAPEATPTGDITYVVEATDNFNCTSTDSIQINLKPVAADPLIFCDQSGPGEVTFIWSAVDTFTQFEVNVNNSGWTTPSGSLEHIVTGLPPGGTAEIQVRAITNSDYCGAEIGLLSCTACTADLVLQSVADTQCSNSCDGEAVLIADSPSPPFTFSITHEDGLYNYDQADGNFTNLCAGNHTIVLEDAVGCVDTTSFQINSPDSISLEVIQLKPVSCFGGNDGEAFADATGGTGPYTYVWSDQLQQILPTANLLEAGVYTVTVTDANGCQAIGSTEIEQPDELQASTSSTDALCFGESTGTATVSVSGGTYPFSFQWSDPGASTDSIATGLLAGSYSVEVIDANGCMSSATISVGQPAQPIFASISQTNISCFEEGNGAAEVFPGGGTPPYSYLWSDNQTTQEATGLDASTYSVTISDDNGCETTQSITLDQHEPMTLTVIFAPPSCFGDTDGAVAVTDVEGGSGSGPYTYLWSANPGNNSDVLEDLPGNNTYSVTVTDAAGCSASKSIFMPEPDPISMEVGGTDVSCFGGEDGNASVLSLQDTITGVTYQWSANANNQTTPTATGLSAGSYTVVVTDGNGCMISGNVELEQPSPVVIDFELTDNPCFGDQQGTISSSVSGGVGPYQFDWSNGSKEENLENLPASLYYLSVTDANNCLYVDSALIEQPDPINPNISTTDVTCFGDSDGRIMVDPEGGTPPYRYSLNDEDYFGSSTLIGLSAGDYEVFVLDDEGCKWSTQSVILSPPPFEVFIDQGEETEIELGETIILSAFTVNETGPVEYIWSAPYEGTLSCTICQETEANTQTTINYEVYAVDSLGCEDDAQIRLVVDKPRRVLVPTGFSPNGDLENDRLLVHGQSGTIIELFQVFDRWGELVYEARDFNTNDQDTGWDGSFRGQRMPGGVYLWYVEARYIDGVRQNFKGTTTLIR